MSWRTNRESPLRRAATTLVLALCLPAPASAAIPDAPFSPWGTVTIDGQAPPGFGGKVEAFVEGRVVATGRITFGSYALDVPGDDPDTPAIEGGTSTTTLLLRVNGLVAAQTPTWVSGDSSELNLTVVVRTLVVDASTPACQVGDVDFTTVSAAVTGANPNDTVVICPGTYSDNVFVSSSISILGVNKDITTVTSANGGHVFEIDADDVTISGLTLLGAVNSAAAGINVFRGSGVRITGNKIKSCTLGIVYGGNHTPNGVVEGNTVTSFGGGCGVTVAGEVEVIGNEILFGRTTNPIFPTGVCVFNDDNVVRDNDILSNDRGILVFNGSNNEIIDNQIIGNALLPGVTKATPLPTSGIELNNSTGNTVRGNVLRGNENGILLAQNSSGNTIEDNEISGSVSFNIYSDLSTPIAAEKNYWGATACLAIDGALRDDEEGQGEVDFEPILDDVPGVGSLTACSGSTLVVDPLGPGCVAGDFVFTDINSAVGAAANGDHVLVCPGTYEENIVVSKSIIISSVSGPSVTTVRSCKFRDVTGCRGFLHIFHLVSVQNARIEGFTLTGTEPSPWGAIALSGATQNTITGNKIEGNDVGVLGSASSTGNIIYNNEFRNNNQHVDDPGSNIWNQWPIQPGINIIGGLKIGGNFWDDYLVPPDPSILPGGDSNNDGIGDVAIPYQSPSCPVPPPPPPVCMPKILVGGDFAPLVP
jgi:parallel beta-helix repeat protein